MLRWPARDYGGAVPWLVALVVAMRLATPAAVAQPVADCEQAGRAAEQKFGVPPGLLLAIGRVESGRFDAAADRVVPQPWAVNIDGASQWFADSEQAVWQARSVQESGRHSIDVGCFQVSLLYHPKAFDTLQQAFDPAANADYAARFLASLKDRLGSWPEAVAAYHSADPQRGGPYRERVMVGWSGAPAPPTADPVTFAGFPGLKLWLPSPGGSGSVVVVVGRQPAVALPRVFSPKN